MGVHRFHPPALNRFFRNYQRRFESGTNGKAFNKKLQLKSQNNKKQNIQPPSGLGSRMF